VRLPHAYGTSSLHMATGVARCVAACHSFGRHSEWDAAVIHLGSHPVGMAENVLHEFTSHIAGKNAKVRIYDNRIEWEKPRGRSLTATVGTMGLNYLAKRGIDTEMIPVKSITSVATKKDGLLNTLVQVITSGNTIDFRVSHAEAVQVRDVLNRLVLQ
jgi:hypothetical protein